MAKKRDIIEICAVRRKRAAGHRLVYWYRVVGPNGKTLLTSETYQTRRACRRSACRFGDRNGIAVVSRDAA